MWKEMLRAGLGSLGTPWCVSQLEPWTTGQRRVLWAEKVGSRKQKGPLVLTPGEPVPCPERVSLGVSPLSSRGWRPHDSGPVQDLANVVCALTGLS